MANMWVAMHRACQRSLESRCFREGQLHHAREAAGILLAASCDQAQHCPMLPMLSCKLPQRLSARPRRSVTPVSSCHGSTCTKLLALPCSSVSFLKDPQNYFLAVHGGHCGPFRLHETVLLCLPGKSPQEGRPCSPRAVKPISTPLHSSSADLLGHADPHASHAGAILHACNMRIALHSMACPSCISHLSRDW